MKKRIYLYKSGQLLRRDNSLCYKTKDGLIHLPIYQIEAINFFNHFNLSKNTIILLNKNEIILNFFNYYGYYCGSYYPYISIRGSYISKQVLFLEDNTKRLKLGKEIILTSIDNMISVIKYYNKKRKNLIDKIELMEKQKKDIKGIEFKSINNLMIYEANFKNLYYSCFSKIVLNSFFKFNKRTIRPPKDAINAIMSYGYAMIYTIIANLIHRSRMQISLPIIHGNVRSIEGLQYDIADIFKPIIVDRLIFRLINKNQINKQHFEIKKDLVYLNKKGARVFIENFEDLLSKTIYVSDSKRYLSYRSILSREVNRIANHIFENKEYKGFKIKW